MVSTRKYWELVHHKDATNQWEMSGRRNLLDQTELVLSAMFKLAVLAGVVGLPLLLLGLTLGIYSYFYSFDRILPGVDAGGIRLAGKTMSQAAIEIHKVWNLENRISVTDGSQVWNVPPYELGLRVDPLATAVSAYQIGRNEDLLGGFEEILIGFGEKRPVELVVVLEEQKARSSMEALAGLVYTAPQNATLYLEGGSLVSVPAVAGLALDVEETLAHLSSNKDSFVSESVFQLTLQQVPPQLDDVTPAINEVKQLLEIQRTILLYDPVINDYMHWDIAQEDMVSLIRIDNTETGPQVTIDEAEAAAYLEVVSQSIGSERWFEIPDYLASFMQSLNRGSPATVVLKYKPASYTVEPGDTLIRIGWKVGLPYWKIIEANPGLDPEALYTGQQLRVPPKDAMLPLPVIPEKRIVISIGQQRLWAYQEGELLSEHVISTGIDRSPTQPGIFQVRTHELNAYASLWDLYMPHFIGIYEAWPGFFNGIHGLPTLSSGQRLWADVLGRPASYGCIILDLPAAEWLYNWAEPGVVVEIVA
jgi:LysM repeat protein